MRRVESLTRRSFVRTAALFAPAAVLAVPGRADGLELDEELLRGRHCAPRDKLPKLLKRDMTIRELRKRTRRP